MIKRLSLILTATAVLGYVQPAHASGFFLIEQSVSAMGNAYAGGAAIAEDASTVFFNPAGMTRICDYELVSGGHLVIPKAQFDDEGSVHISGVALTGGDGHDSGEAALVPHTYFVKSCDCWSFGLGINSPFGLATDYGHKWKGRYHAIRSAIMTINLNPSIAYRFNRCWSIGAGIDVMYMHAKLTNAVDFGLIYDQALQSLGILQPGQYVYSQTLDGKAIVKGNGWGYGANVGILWEPCCGTRFGATYRSEIKQRLKGSEKFQSIPAQISGTPALAAIFQNTRTRSDVTLPSMASISGYHELNNCWAVMGDLSWTKWNVVKTLHFKFKNPNQVDSFTTTKWQNSLRYSLGTSYSPNECWTYRTGVSFDETPIRSKELRTPRLPGEDRTWLAFGVGYKWSCCMKFDFGYAHLFVKKPKIDKSGFTHSEDILRGGVKGDYDNAKTDIVSAQLVWDF